MLREKIAKSVLNKHKKRDDWFLDEYSVNPYEGCSCNCLYCYVRGSRYGENMEDGLAVKSNAAGLLDKQLATKAKKGQFGFIALGSATDAYIHHEERYGLTRSLLEIILKHRFPVFISTKCTLITRDLDLLKQIDQQAILPADLQTNPGRGAILSISLSTLDEKITDMLEPAASAPLERIALLGRLKQEGFLAGVNAMPLLPFISDTEEEIEKIVIAAAQQKADYLLGAGLTLFGEGPTDSKTLFYKFIQRYDASLLPNYQQLFGNNFYTPFAYQQQLKERIERLCKKHSIRTHIRL